jgi:hypothetical protein
VGRMQVTGRHCVMLHASGFLNVNVCEALVNETAFWQRPCEVKCTAWVKKELKLVKLYTLILDVLREIFEKTFFMLN